MIQIECPVCKTKCKNVWIHINAKEDKEHIEYLQKLYDRIDYYLKHTNLLYGEIINELEKEGFPRISSSIIRIRNKKLDDPDRGIKIMALRRTGNNNPVHYPGVREKISNSVKTLWEAGVYEKRINGMLGITGEKSHNYNYKLHTPKYLAEKNYNNFLSNFQDITKCSKCGATNVKINVHHIDENHKNFLISNLEPLCVNCHMKHHYTWAKQPFITIGKKFKFASSHRLPNHPDKCNDWHGHEWILEVCIRKRINDETGMVMDFSDLKEIVTTEIIDNFDHNIINEFVTIPTAENILVYIWEQLMFNSLLKGICELSLWESADSVAKITTDGMLSIFSSKVESYMKTKSLKK